MILVNGRYITMGNEVTGTVSGDGTLVIKGEDGNEVRYVKEADLLAVKGSKENVEKAAKEAEAARDSAIAEANSKVDAEHQKVLQAEARVSSLEEQVRQGGGSAAELAKATADLAAAKTSSEELGNKFLELKRNVITQAYGVPKETVANKDLAALEVYEEALKAVIGDKSIGNFAVGAGGGGQNPLVGKDPMTLAVEAYAQSRK